MQSYGGTLQDGPGFDEKRPEPWTEHEKLVHAGTTISTASLKWKGIEVGSTLSRLKWQLISLRHLAVGVISGYQLQVERLRQALGGQEMGDWKHFVE
jgi:hypothetical protein